MTTSRKIYFICPNNKFAAGGVKHIYHQVAILNSQGYNAVVLHKSRRKREQWFDNNVPVEYSPYLFKKIKHSIKQKKRTFFSFLSLTILKSISSTLEKNSILVFPEFYGLKLNEIEPELKRVIFNQNCYYTFNNTSLLHTNKENTYSDRNTIATIVASEDAYNYLSYTLPNLPLHRIRLGLNQTVFSYSNKKKMKICFMPRKLAEDVLQVINILRLKRIDKNWEFISIENKSESEVARILQESAIFLSFNHREGFGLPPVEAMACGCYVIGYKGRGGQEYFNTEFSIPIEDGNIIEFVKQIILATIQFENHPQDILNKGKLASDFVLGKYSTSHEEQDILKIWSKILS